MNSKLLLCLALVLSGAVTISTAQVQPPPLRIVIKVSQATIHIKKKFTVALRVENPTATNQAVRVMSCSWWDEWQSNNPKISPIPWGYSDNGPITVQIPPGGAYTNELEVCIYKPIPDKIVTFRMGFTPIGSKKAFWSNEQTIEVVP
jgi:hypothetical protein